MTITTTPRPNVGSSGIIDPDGFEGFGSGGFDEDDLRIIGDELDNLLVGGIGHDEIEGNGGNDTINGGEGNDSLGGGAGDDIIDGQGGGGTFEKDKLFGDAGNDILRAGFGFDELTGGSGNDIFEVYALGHFTIRDFTLGEDRLLFDTNETGVRDLDHLIQLISRTEQREDGATVEFLDNAVSIELVGINLADITPDMVIFSL
ncbi:MAG: hemolysin expression modulating protein [Betaproteobacteria bacterium]|nr:hemolysin expression modulating protein [Betaproteobacteria bacterium]